MVGWRAGSMSRAWLIITCLLLPVIVPLHGSQADDTTTEAAQAASDLAVEI